VAINQLQVATQGFIGRLPSGIYSHGFIDAAIIIPQVGGSSTKQKKKKRVPKKNELPIVILVNEDIAIEQVIEQDIEQVIEQVNEPPSIRLEPIAIPNVIRAIKPNFDFVPYIPEDNIDVIGLLQEQAKKKRQKRITMLLLSI